MGCPYVVSIQVGNEFARRLPEAGIPRCADSPVLAMDQADPFILGPSGQCTTIIGTAIIHDDQLEVSMRLVENGLDCPFQRICSIINGHYDTEGDSVEKRTIGLIGSLQLCDELFCPTPVKCLTLSAYCIPEPDIL